MNTLEKSAAVLAIILIIFGAGAYVGHKNTDPKIVYRTAETTHEDFSKFEVVKPEVITKVVQGPVVVRRVIVIKAPDGTLTTDTTDTKSAPVVTDAVAKADAVKVETKTVTITKEVIKWKANEAPRWAVQLLTGTDTTYDMKLGGAFSYRFAGPFTLGVYGLKGDAGPTQGGVSVGFTF